MKIRHNLFYTAAFLIVLMASLPLASAYTLNYDANGNLISGDGKFRTYDGFNHLVEVRNGTDASGLMLEQYEWHPIEDRIVAKHVYENGTWKETVIYASKTFVVVKNATGEFRYKYIYQNGHLVAQQNMNTSEKLFFHNDNLGSVGLITNESGAKVEETMYAPFGEIISGGETSRYDYTGKEFDSVTGDYDFNARKYDTKLGIFTSPDTLLPNVYDPQSLNRYSYVTNNPYKYTDTNGKYAMSVHQKVTFMLSTLTGFNSLISKNMAHDTAWTDIWRNDVLNSAYKEYHFSNRQEVRQNLMAAIREADLTSFAQWLHALQDSYAHEGYDEATHGVVPNIEGLDPRKWSLLKNMQIDELGTDSQADTYMMMETYHFLNLLYDRLNYLTIITEEGEEYEVGLDIYRRYPNVDWSKKEEGKGLCLTCPENQKPEDDEDDD